jgi:hypothetical protein
VRTLTTYITRKVVMFLLGAGGFIHELLRTGEERPVILAVCCTLMGLPFVLRGEETLRDERTRKDDDGRR